MKSLIVISTCVVAAAMAYPSPYPMPVPSPMAMALAFPDHAPSYHAPPPKYEPPVHVPVHKGYEEVLGRVKMQIYRGPSVGKGYDVFAPWGYYDTQPADFHKKKYH